MDLDGCDLSSAGHNSPGHLLFCLAVLLANGPTGIPRVGAEASTSVLAENSSRSASSSSLEAVSFASCLFRAMNSILVTLNLVSY